MRAPKSFERTKNTVDWGRRNGVYPGAAVSVGDGGGELFRDFCGYRTFVPQPEKVSETTLFDVASLTKIMSTTMVALKFIESDKLRLSQRLGDFFDAPADKQNVDIWHLMTHTSGLPAHVKLWGLGAPADAVRHILGLSPLYAPGSGVTYSCLGFILLAKICEQVGGANLDVLARNMVFGPLGMINTGYGPIADENVAATEYDFEEGRYTIGRVHDENARYLGGVSGNAGLFSPIGDCAIFAQMLANKGIHNGKEFINRDLFNDSIRNHTPGLDEGRGLGFVVKCGLPSSAGEIFPDGSYGHTGFTGTSIFVNAETAQYLALLTNRVHPTRENEGMVGHRKRVHDASAEDYNA